jgi:hypothetical protein
MKNALYRRTALLSTKKYSQPSKETYSQPSKLTSLDRDATETRRRGAITELGECS